MFLIIAQLVYQLNGTVLIAIINERKEAPDPEDPALRERLHALSRKFSN
jgi:hypothetical protein